MSEIKCNQCGSNSLVQDGTQYQCLACGTKFSAEDLNLNEVEPKTNQTPKPYDGSTEPYGVNQQNPYNQQYNSNQQNTYSQQQVPAKRKSMIISMILSIILVGFGLIYLGFIKRWLVAVVISIVLSIVFFPLGLIWFLYMLYDTYVCTNAINNAQVIPKLAGFIDMN